MSCLLSISCALGDNKHTMALTSVSDAGSRRKCGHGSGVDSGFGGGDLQPEDERHSHRAPEGLPQSQHLPLLHPPHRHLLHVLHLSLDAGARVQRVI